MKLQTRLKKLRLKHHMTQDNVADRLNVSRKTISSWENGHSIPDDYLLEKLTKLYKYPLAENRISSNAETSFNEQKIINDRSQKQSKPKKYWLIGLLLSNAIIFIMSMMNFLNDDFSGIGFLQLIIDSFSLIYLNKYLIQIIKANRIIILISTVWFILFVYMFVIKSYSAGHSKWPIMLVTLKSIFDTTFFTYVFIILISSGHLYKKIINDLK